MSRITSGRVASSLKQGIWTISFMEFGAARIAEPDRFAGHLTGLCRQPVQGESRQRSAYETQG